MTPRQRELSEQLYGGQSRSKGVMGTIQGLFPGLSLDKFGKDVGHEITQQAKAGAHEMAAALFSGHAFVMYQREGKEDQPSHDNQHQNEPQDHHLEHDGHSL